MSDRQQGATRPGRPSSSTSRAVRVRMLSTGRWRAPLGPAPGHHAPRVIAVGAALPGVGKSVVASNLAVAVGGLGRQVTLVDLDLAAPRQHLLFGVAAAETGERPTGVRNVRLCPAAAVAEAPDPDARAAALDELGDAGADVVIVDIGHARRDDLWSSFAGAERLLVTTGARESLEATYAFLHQAAERARARHGAAAPEVLARFAGGLVGNVAAGADEAEAFHAFARLVREELGIPLAALGCLRRSPRIARSTAAGKPICASKGIDDEVRVFHQLAEELVSAHAGRELDCSLDGAPATLGPAVLPVDFGRFQRKHPRFTVDWAATLEFDGEPNAVRVCDVSESGTAIETTLVLQVGDRALLHFYQLDDEVAVEVVVKNVVSALNRIGLGFVSRGAAAARIVRAARARLATP
jgi:MinD-like ATPase involved in chromosome partitioning or flagellar assembly